MSIASLLAELRRRQVFRAAAWYAGTAAAITQVLDLVADRFGLPPRLMQGVILLGLAGFPLTCVISWFFDFSREGIRPEVAAPDAATTPAKPWATPSLWFALVAGGLFALGAQQAWRVFVAPAERPGIAVLGFDVLGVEANRALSGGLHEAVLDELAHVSGLRVIARTSVLRFADAKPDIREVGRILDVPFVLEGSVLREGEQLRVHAQLIDAATNEHVWSETYDRSAADIFGVQTALARDIAARLRVSLLPQERTRAEAAPTTVAAAYDSYLRSAEAFTRYQQHDQLDSPLLREAIAAVDEALRLDPDFALAHAERSRMLSTLWWVQLQGDPAQAKVPEDALAAASAALRLDPDLGEAHRALGLYYYWGLLDYARAERSLARARELLPNDAATTWILGLVRRRQNRGEEALGLFAEAYRLDPANASVRGVYANSLYWRRHFTAAQQVIEEMLARFPESRELLAVRGELEFCRSGNTGSLIAAAEAGVGDTAFDAYPRWRAAILDDRYAEALPIVQSVEGESFGWTFRSLALAETQTLLGDTAGATETLRPIIADVEQKIAATPEKLNVRRGLGLAYALSGRPDDARRITEEHLAHTPLERNALDNAVAHFEAAEVYATIGDAGKAISHLEAAQKGGFSTCGNLLRRLPVFASLRGDPRFEALASQSDWR